MITAVTASQSGAGSANGMALTVKVLTGALAASLQNGATIQNNSSITTAQASVTPHATGSVIYGAVANGANSSNFTALASTTMFANVSDAVNGAGYGTLRGTAVTTGGTPVTIGASAPVSGAGAAAVAFAEILAAGTIAEDASSPASVSTTAAKTAMTAAFTPPASSLLVAMVSNDFSGGGTNTISVSDAAGLAWRPLVQDSYTVCSVWVADVPAAFPDSPLDLKIEVDAGGTWTDLSARNDHGNVVIGRGHPDESATVAPSTIEMELTNADAALSPDNPQSPLWPYLLQNIPGRVSIAEGASYLRNETDKASGASSSAVTVPADVDAQIDVTLDSGWTQGAALVSQWVTSGNDRCWFLALDWDGTLVWGMTTDGTMGTFQFAKSTLPVTAPPSGRMSARVTWDHTAGTATFYTSATALNASPSWTQLGSAVTLTAASPHSGSSTIVIGQSVNTDFLYSPYSAAWSTSVNQFPGFYGKCHAAKVLTGATVKAFPDFTVQTAGSTSFADSAGVTWTLQGTAEISSRNYRAHMELSEWPQDEPPVNPAGTPDAVVQVKGGGLLRRYTQRNRPTDSAWVRGLRQLMLSPGLAACWPMEDAAGSQSLADITGGQAMTWTGSPKLASNSDFPGSNALPVLNGAQFTGRMNPSFTGWTDNVARCVAEIPNGETAGAVILSLRTYGTVARADMTYDGSGKIGLSLYNSAGTLIASTGSLTPFGSGLAGALCRLSVYLQASGGNVIYAIEALRQDGNYATASGSIAGSIGAVSEVAVNPGGLLVNTVLGGLSVQPLFTSVTDMAGPLAAWDREPAGWRMSRLCGEEGIPFRARGNLASTTLMGVQTPQTIAALCQQCADADLGIWTELRQALGWGYVTRQALYNQAAMVGVDYHQDHLSPWTSPPQRDDQYIINDVTYDNADGSSARQYAAAGQPITGGRFSTGTPGSSTPSAGTYDQSYSVAIAQDSDLGNLAGWRLHLGTVDQARFPGIVLDLSNRALAPQFTSVLAMDLGHRVTVANPPLRWGAGQVTQLAQQLTETLGAYELEIAVTGVPELPYQVFQVSGGSGPSHIDTDGSTLHANYTYGAATMTVDTALGFALWTTSAGDFPFNVMVSGMVLTVANITGSSSPQTFSVTPGVNGVQKNLTAGAAVNVWPPPVIGL